MLEVRLLSKRFGDKMALDGVNVKLEQRKIVGLLGVNGAGIRSRNKKTANNDVINRIIPSFERKRHSSLFHVYRAGKMDWRSIGESRLSVFVKDVAR